MHLEKLKNQKFSNLGRAKGTPIFPDPMYKRIRGNGGAWEKMKLSK